MNDEQRRRRRGPSKAWLIVAIILGILILGDLNRRMANARRLERDARMLSTEVSQLAAENQDLQTQVAGATSDAMVEEWARSEGRMVREGERLIIPVPADPQSGGITPTPVPASERPTNWEVWLALLFGG
ncbi:MAG: FtsB family cell division protein [Anaerolineales bacterium]